jgi:hypothetical protein
MIRIRYRPTELMEGAVDTVIGDKFIILPDNTVEIKQLNERTGKYRVVGMIHPDRWESVVLMEDTEA